MSEARSTSVSSFLSGHRCPCQAGRLIQIRKGVIQSMNNNNNNNNNNTNTTRRAALGRDREFGFGRGHRHGGFGQRQREREREGKMPHGVSCRAFGAFNFRRSGRPEHSEKAHREVVLFLAQRELESAFQRLVNMEMYEEARQIASQQEKLQEIVEGETSAGLDSASSSDDTSAEGNANDKLNDGEVVVKLLSLRTDLQRAIDNEDYARASVVRDEILEIEDAMQKQKSSKPPVKKNKPK